MVCLLNLRFIVTKIFYFFIIVDVVSLDLVVIANEDARFICASNFSLFYFLT